jgi:hypothetical protein
VIRRLAVSALVLLAVCAASGTARAQPQSIDLSEVYFCNSPQVTTPTVDLYTFGVGPAIFEKFGHAALCVSYPPERPSPICFNYGATNFEEPAKLVWGFMRATQKFWVEPTPYIVMKRFYQHEDRDIFRQTLPLDDQAARDLTAGLCHDLLPENKDYVYHHFEDNCTTRLRDKIDRATGGKLREGSDHRVALSLRGYGRRGMSEFVPLIAISDFITGRDLDYYPTQWEAMFHPEVLREQVALKLGVEPELVSPRHGPPFPTDGPSGRWVVVLVSFLLAVPLVLVRLRGWRRERLAIAVAAIPLMLWGVALWLIFAFVSINWIRWNEVMVMYLPLDLAIPFLSAVRLRKYAQVRVAMVALASGLAAIGVFRQPLWVPAICAFVPLGILAFDLPPPRVRAVPSSPLSVPS